MNPVRISWLSRGILLASTAIWGSFVAFCGLVFFRFGSVSSASIFVFWFCAGIAVAFPLWVPAISPSNHARSIKIGRKVCIYLAPIAIAVGWVAWDVFLLPSSFGEALFRYRLSRAVQTPKIEIKLAELATFDWEEVCSLHPYDGEFKHPRYSRTYHTPMRAANDGVWTLLFIGKDGGPTYVSGKCAFIRDFGCRSRSDAIFRIERTTDTCPFLSAIPTHGENQILSSGLP